MSRSDMTTLKNLPRPTPTGQKQTCLQISMMTSARWSRKNWIVKTTGTTPILEVSL